MPNPFRFEILHTSNRSKARVGRIHTPHGTIETPGFVAVGTNGTIKSLSHHEVDKIGVELMFCNTYHLILQPGPDIVELGGGLHSFIGRKMPLITDSGGFQVFSLAYGGVASELKSKGTKKNDGSVLKITEDGVLFRSYRDGSPVLLTPETSVLAQKKLGADIIIPFDELPPYHISHESLNVSLERTHRWEKRSLDAHLANPKGQAMYAVIHGGINKEFRLKSASYLGALPFDGYSVGGSVGKDKGEMFHLLSYTLEPLDPQKPRHLLGIGDLESLSTSISYGIDTFDSSYPTKAARHGMAFTFKGNVNLTKGENKTAFRPIEEDCPCSTCQGTTLAFLHHLFKAKELSALSLATIHNLTFMIRRMRRYREQILNNEL
jgi:queuine tRNA-ribosyltransferase